MCHTNYIKSLIATTPSHTGHNIVQMSMKRSDGELFTARIALLSANDAEKIKTLFNHFEELRTCLCTGNTVCEKHSSLEKK